jgi:hypothetical protein
VPNTGVSFLNSGAFLKAILQRTQCWCVDDGSKFILKSQGYYRIELPSATDHEQSQIEELKKVLERLCRYEKTPCPFRQGYQEPPEKPPTPLRRQSSTTERAKRWRLNGVWEPEDADLRAEFEKKNKEITERFQHGRSSSLRLRKPEQRTGIKTDPFFESPRPAQRASSFGGVQLPRITLKPAPSPEKAKASRLSGLRTGLFESLSRDRLERPSPPSIQEDFLETTSTFAATSRATESSAELPLEPVAAAVEPPSASKTDKIVHDSDVSSAPIDQIAPEINPTPQIIIVPQQSLTEDETPKPTYDPDTLSVHSSNDSFYSFDDELSIYHEPRLSPGAESLHSRSSSSGTAVPPTPRGPPEVPWSPLIGSMQSCELSDSTSSDHSSDEVTRVPSIAQALRRRRVSPMRIEDHMQNQETEDRLQLHHPAKAVHSSLSPREIGGTVLRKTCDILLGPSFSLIALMIRIAQHILKRSPVRHRETVPGSWESDSEDLDDDTEWEDAIELDDYGFPLSSVPSDAEIPDLSHEQLIALSSAVETMVRNGQSDDGWEVD